MNEANAIKFINQHKDDELTKIEDNYVDATNMYAINMNFSDAKKIYKEISNRILKKYNV